MSAALQRGRPLIAFFEYADVFEDFYPRLGVDQREFAAAWADTGNHNFVRLLQREVGDVLWCCLSLAPALTEARHTATGCRVRMLRSSWLHRLLWKIFWLPKIAWRWRGLYPLYATLASYLAPLSAPLVRTLWRERPDAIFVQDYSSGKFDVLIVLARLLRIPLFTYHSGSVPEEYLGAISRRITLPRAHRIFASSSREADMLAARFGVNRERVPLILTPLDTTLYRPLGRSCACRIAGLDAGRRRLLFMGRLDDQVKRVGLAIRCFAELARQFDDTDLLVCGTGPDEAALRKLADELVPGRVRFAGWISDASRKIAIYSACEALVLPSVREGFPTVVAESLACGTPVVAADVGGVRELVLHGESGYLFAPGDTAQLSPLLASLLGDASRLADMRRAARALAERRVAEDVIANQLRGCFDVVNHHRTR